MNVHGLQYLPDDVERYGLPLVEMSAFDFEKHMQVLKKFVRKSQAPCTQVLKRLGELETLGVKLGRKSLSTVVTAGGRDSWFLMENMKLCRVIKISGKDLICIVLSSSIYDDFFKHVPSKSIDTFKVFTNQLGGPRHLKEIS